METSVLFPDLLTVSCIKVCVFQKRNRRLPELQLKCYSPAVWVVWRKVLYFLMLDVYFIRSTLPVLFLLPITSCQVLVLCGCTACPNVLHLCLLVLCFPRALVHVLPYALQLFQTVMTKRKTSYVWESCNLVFIFILSLFLERVNISNSSCHFLAAEFWLFSGKCGRFTPNYFTVF